MKQFLWNLWEVLEVVLISAITVFVIRSYVVQPFLVSGASMEPNFSGGNYLLIDEVTYRFQEPERGQIIVFRYPGDNKTFYIKRLIGLPSDRIIITDGQVIINGKVLQEDYLPDNLLTVGHVDRKLGKDEFFVLGDNRNYSYDSRQWGVVPKGNVVGLVRLRLFPFNKINLFDTPAYSNG